MVAWVISLSENADVQNNVPKIVVLKYMSTDRKDFFLKVFINDRLDSSLYICEVAHSDDRSGSGED